MSPAVIAHVDKVATNDEEDEETGPGSLSYIPRTIPTNTPFFKTSSSLERDRAQGFNSVRDISSSILMTPSVQQAREVPSAAVENPEEFDNDANEFEEAHEYQDAREFRTPAGADYNPRNLESHGPDHYGRLEAKPIRDSQDRLWTEIDALDDVKRLAKEVNLYEGFPSGFEEELSKIRVSHAHLLRAMRDRNARIEEERRHDITSRADSHGNSNDLINKHTTGNVGRIISNTTTAGPSSGNRTAGRIDQDFMGATVKADEDKYVQEMIENIKSIRI